MTDSSTIEDYIAKATEELNRFDIPYSEYLSLYSSVEDPSLQHYFSKAQSIIVKSYRHMNALVSKGGKHYHADESRQLHTCINSIKWLRDKLLNSSHEFQVSPYYDEIFEHTLDFLVTSGGSKIPFGWESVDLPRKKCIFTMTSTIEIDHTGTEMSFSNYTKVGSGSFATVYKAFDKFLNRDIAIKKANANLEEKDIERLANEFTQLSKLDSPYIVDVYSYNADKNWYTMEYMPYNFDKYNEQHNPNEEIRRKIALQILSASEYIDSKKLFHRDLSPNNVLIREYKDGSIVAKLSDFGLVKNPDFQLTNFDTNPKGTFIAPELSSGHISFKQYSIKQEVYALTRLLFFIITGKSDPDDSTPAYLKKAYNTGTHSDPDQRPDNIATVKALFFQ